MVFDIRDYGALVDGVTDDSAAVESAVNAAIAAGGGTVYFPAGTTKFATAKTLNATTPVNTTANITFAGDGDILFGPDSSLRLANFGQVLFSGLSFIGTNTLNTAAVSGAFIFVSSSVSSVFENCRFYGLGTADDSLFAGVVTGYYSPLIFNNCFFGGCVASAAAVVTSFGGSGLRMVNTQFLDFGVYKGVTYSTSLVTVKAWVQLTEMTDVTAANRRSSQFVNCTFDEAPLWCVKLRGTNVTRKHNATFDNCHFNTGRNHGNGSYGAAIHANEMLSVRIIDTTCGYADNTVDYCVAEFNNVDVVDLDNLRGLYGAKYVRVGGETGRVRLRDCSLVGNATYPLGWDNDAGALIEADSLDRHIVLR